MSRPETMLKKMYCTHGFPPLMCNSCAGQALCVHGMPGGCLLCGLRGSGTWLNKTAVGYAKGPAALSRPVIVAESKRKPGLNEDGTIANDMKYGDYTKAQIENLDSMFRIYDLDKVSAKTLFTDMRLMSTSLFARGDLEDNIKKMIDKFENNTGGTYSHSKLNEAVRNHESTKRFVEQIRKGLAAALKTHKGRIDHLIKNIDVRLIGRPVFNSTSDTLAGLTIAINDTWAYTVSVTNYELSGKHYKGVFSVALYDHFGLDQPDVEKVYKYLAGFRTWFILQHLKRFAYKPFITKIEMTHSFEGHLS